MDDIYKDLDSFEMGDTIKELQTENAKLTENIDTLTATLKKTVKDLEEVKKANVILQQNISKLYNTAKADYDRRTRTIQELQRKIDDFTFRRNQNFRIPKRKAENHQEVNEPVEIKKRKVGEGLQTKENKHFNERNKSNKPVSKDNYKNDSSRRDKPNRNNENRYNKRRSRSRSREKRRRSPMRDTYHRSSRDYDNKSKNISPNSRHRKNVNVEPDSFEIEQKKVLELIKRKQVEHSDSESVVSVHSDSSYDLLDVKKETRNIERDKLKNKQKTSNLNIKSVKNKEINMNKVSNKNENIIKEKNNVSEEIEEGEVSDDDCDISEKNLPKEKQKSHSKDNKIYKNETNLKGKIAEENINSQNASEDFENLSTNDASISFLMQKSEELKKEINKYSLEDSSVSAANVICEESKNINVENKENETKSDSVSIITQPANVSTETTNKATLSAENKPKRRRCVLMIN